MYNPVTKALRYLRREYPETSVMGSVMGAFGLAFGIGVALTPGAPLIVAPLVAAVIPGFGMLLHSAGGGEGGRTSGNDATINGVKVVGDRRDVASIAMTQRLIDKITSEHSHLPALPPRVTNRIARHLDDVQGAMLRVRFYDPLGKPAAFSFQRSADDKQGRVIRETVATLDTTHQLPEPTPVPLAFPQAPKPAALLAAPSPAPEFAALSRKVEDVAGRVERLEHPPEVKLDKPKFTKP